MIDYSKIDPDLESNPLYHEIKSRVPCLAKAQRDFANHSAAVNGHCWEALADALHGDVRAYLMSSE